MDKLDLVVKKIDELKADSEKKHDQMQEDVTEIKDCMIEMTFDVRRNADDLVVHMKRTDLNEKRIERIEGRLTIEYLLKLILSLAGGIGVVSGAIYAIIKLINSI